MRDKTEPNDSAFPGDVTWVVGLTKREYFAAHILAGLVSGAKNGATIVASDAVKGADALIEALNAEKQG